MRLFKTNEPMESVEDVAAAGRLLAIASRCRAEHATDYSDFQGPVEQTVVAEPDEDAASAADEWPVQD